MSAYALQKMLRDINRKPDCREAYFAAKEQFAQSYDLSDAERDAFVRFDIGRLYEMGVHGLILRPFTLLHGLPEPDYLKAIRGDA